jgi:uroporphyrinogen decarboxylase (EC 4.1.1.37)
VEAGASAVQLFDSWVGSLSRRDYQRRVRPHSERALSSLRGLDVPKVHFGVGSSDVLDLMAGIADVVGVDWRLPLDEAALRLGGAVRFRATSILPCSRHRGRRSRRMCVTSSSAERPPPHTC